MPDETEKSKRKEKPKGAPRWNRIYTTVAAFLCLTFIGGLGLLFYATNYPHDPEPTVQAQHYYYFLLTEQAMMTQIALTNAANATATAHAEVRAIELTLTAIPTGG